MRRDDDDAKRPTTLTGSFDQGRHEDHATTDDPNDACHFEPRKSKLNVQATRRNVNSGIPAIGPANEKLRRVAVLAGVQEMLVPARKMKAGAQKCVIQRVKNTPGRRSPRRDAGEDRTWSIAMSTITAPRMMSIDGSDPWLRSCRNLYRRRCDRCVHVDSSICEASFANDAPFPWTKLSCKNVYASPRSR